MAVLASGFASIATARSAPVRTESATGSFKPVVNQSTPTTSAQVRRAMVPIVSGQVASSNHVRDDSHEPADAVSVRFSILMHLQWVWDSQVTASVSPAALPESVIHRGLPMIGWRGGAAPRSTQTMDFESKVTVWIRTGAARRVTGGADGILVPRPSTDGVGARLI